MDVHCTFEGDVKKNVSRTNQTLETIATRVTAKQKKHSIGRTSNGVLLERADPHLPVVAQWNVGGCSAGGHLGVAVQLVLERHLQITDRHRETSRHTKQTAPEHTRGCSVGAVVKSGH